MKAKCASCGQLYRINSEDIETVRMNFKCTKCSGVTLLKISDLKFSEMNILTAINEDTSHKLNGENKQYISTRFKNKIGLQFKMAFLFIMIPIFLVAISGLIHLKQMTMLSSVLTLESSKMIEKIAREVIADKARSVAVQCENYLRDNPQLKRKDFPKDKFFFNLGMQKVGTTGYTCLYSVPDMNGKSSLWIHPNPKLLGIDMPKAMRRTLGVRYDDWYNIYKGAYQGQESMGKYLWQDEDGQFREKFMVCTPIKGTSYIIASTTYMHEFTQDAIQMYNRAQRLTNIHRTTAFAILIGKLIILGIVVTLFSNGLSKRIKSLTKMAERISLGDLNIQTKDDSGDEIGQLAIAIDRMRTSIRLSMNRLQNRT
ncbi:MAG: HAMP domain-containing protein [Desulfobacteraceae bacterium]|jgi:HAMP domain-containing protein